MIRRPAAYLLIAVTTALVACSPSAQRTTTVEKQPPAEPVYTSVDSLTAGTISGKVTFKGPRLRRAALRIDEDPGCTKLNKSGLLDESVIVNPDGSVANAFVYVKQGLEGKQFRPPAATEVVTIDQKGCRFAPHVIGLRVGQMLRVTNSDPVTHNIHPMPRENREWNQSQPEGAAALERRFVRPEIMMRVKCNVHSWMRAYVSVMEHPYFAVTAGDGSFTIPNLPPGNYTIEAHHEKLGMERMEVTLEPSASKAIRLVLPGPPKQ